MTCPPVPPRSPLAASGATHAVCNGSRNGSPPAAPAGPRADTSTVAPTCPVCAAPLASSRARYCSAACRQQAFRLRHPPTGPAGQAAQLARPTLRRLLQRQHALVAHTVYECPRCETRFVGERRCPDCHVFCRALGLGGLCPECDHPVLLQELVALLGKEVDPAPTNT